MRSIIAVRWKAWNTTASDFVSGTALTVGNARKNAGKAGGQRRAAHGF